MELGAVTLTTLGACSVTFTVYSFSRCLKVTGVSTPATRAVVRSTFAVVLSENVTTTLVGLTASAEVTVNVGATVFWSTA
ncbi:hypothetical protein D3C74_444670 [compost metagenome]